MPVEIKLVDVDSLTLKEFTSVRLKENYTNPLGEYHFEIAPGKAAMGLYRNKVVKGSTLTIHVNGIQQATAIVDTITWNVGKGGVTCSIDATNLLGPVYETPVEPGLTFKSKSDSPIVDTVLAAMKDFDGLDTLYRDERGAVDAMMGGEGRSGTKAQKTSLDKVQDQELTAQPNERIYEFLARVFTRNGVVLRMAHDGGLLITAPDYIQKPAYKLIESQDLSVRGNRFVGDISETDTNDDQFSECIVRGARVDNPETKTTAKPSGKVESSDLNASRPPYSSKRNPNKRMYVQDKHAKSPDRCRSVAKLALGLRAKDAYVISGTVRGFQSVEGFLWTVDTVADVQIESLDLKSELWVLERTFIQDRQGGERTELKLIPKNYLVFGDLPS